MEQDRSNQGEPRILSEEERVDFQGITIDEEGKAYEEEDDYTNPYQNMTSSFKVFTLSSLNWKWKLGLAIVAGIILAIIFFFGAFIITGLLAIVAVFYMIKIIMRILS